MKKRQGTSQLGMRAAMGLKHALMPLVLNQSESVLEVATGRRRACRYLGTLLLQIQAAMDPKRVGT